MAPRPDPHRFVRAISASGLSIYDPIEIGDPALWIPTPELEVLLDREHRGLSVAGLRLRTRSKVVKEHVCRALGYPVPASFERLQPRFPGQGFDTYVQKSNNLQVWNEQLSPTRRYVLIRVSPAGLITRVKVVTGKMLADLDKTRTLTQKYQARCIPGGQAAELVVSDDTDRLRPFVSQTATVANEITPLDYPEAGQLLSIACLFRRLAPLVHASFDDAGQDQERNRGALMHNLVCKAIGYSGYRDDGHFPDVRHQLLEVKLQTSPTIDLGLVTPDSREALGVPKIEGRQIRHCDVRYAVFYGNIDENRVTLTNLFLTTGEAFFTRFPRFDGR